MARQLLRLPDNATGEFYVDSTHIDCDSCRQTAPTTYEERAEKSIVIRQPRTPEETRRALMALVACQTASIGTATRRHAGNGAAAFPERLFDGVYFCSFTAESSFGAWAYLIVRPHGSASSVPSLALRRPIADPDAWPHSWTSGTALPEQRTLRGRPPSMVTRAGDTHRLSRALLELVDRADAFHDHTARLPV